MVCLITLTYMLAHKPMLLVHVDSAPSITLRKLTDGDALAIHAWPAYPEAVTKLDYALRKGGWLDQFPQPEGHERFAAWAGDELAGFSLLTKSNDSEAEFYIAVHPYKLGGGIGRELTLQTLAVGFKKLKLRRIHLKVRDWHTGAIALYRSVGFEEYGKGEEPIQGTNVLFVKMEIHRPRLRDRLGFIVRDRISALKPDPLEGSRKGESQPTSPGGGLASQ